jgi:hypothetical protein
MKDVYEVLRLKEIELSRVEAEVEALRMAAPLLSEDGGSSNDTLPISTRWTAPTLSVPVPKATNTDPQPERGPDWHERTVNFP